MTKILAINGSYRDDGMTDQVVEVMAGALKDLGAKVEVIQLRDYPIEFCLNCRECTQQPGASPGHCVHRDGMQDLVKKIEESDAYILAAPTNFGSVTAVFKRFMERLIVYAYWPWNEHAPQFRKTKVPKKKAVLISSCAAPGILGRWLYSSQKQLKMTAQTIGANTAGTLFTGFSAKEPKQRHSERVKEKAKILALKLA